MDEQVEIMEALKPAQITEHVLQPTSTDTKKASSSRLLHSEAGDSATTKKRKTCTLCEQAQKDTNALRNDIEELENVLAKSQSIEDENESLREENEELRLLCDALAAENDELRKRSAVTSAKR